MHTLKCLEKSQIAVHNSSGNGIDVFCIVVAVITLSPGFNSANAFRSSNLFLYKLCSPIIKEIMRASSCEHQVIVRLIDGILG